MRIPSYWPNGQVPEFARAFSYFSQLANIAEDQHHIRRTRVHALAASAPREGTIAHALNRARDAAISRATEVRRKSTIDREVEVAQLLEERDRLRLTPEETAANEEALRSAVLTLWQTSMLRESRLKVVDEIANGLSYYDYTFLRELPRFYAALEDQLVSTDPAWENFELLSFLR
jgi:phosphoenolpyruvate carboxylase